jgi:hypothetical protein
MTTDETPSRTGLRIACALVVLAVAGAVFATAAGMPERVASSFGPGSRARVLQSRATYQALITAFAVIVPLVCYVGLGLLPRRVGYGNLNFPHPDVWFSPERRHETLDWVERFALVQAAMTALYVGAMHALIVRANSFDPPRLDLGLGLALLVAWLAFIFGSVLLFGRRFRSLTGVVDRVER